MKICSGIKKVVDFRASLTHLQSRKKQQAGKTAVFNLSAAVSLKPHSEQNKMCAYVKTVEAKLFSDDICDRSAAEKREVLMTWLKYGNKPVYSSGVPYISFWPLGTSLCSHSQLQGASYLTRLHCNHFFNAGVVLINAFLMSSSCLVPWQEHCIHLIPPDHMGCFQMWDTGVQAAFWVERKR